jgi:uncharacterized protein (TIGR02145 family)
MITYPTNNGDSIWCDTMLHWTKCNDPNGHAVKYKVVINFPAPGYGQVDSLAVVSDTFIRLNDRDTLGIKIQVIAFDTLGAFSAWSAERPVYSKPLVKDVDGNGYHYVTIGMQVWLVENLKTTKYNDGSTIPLVTDGTAWSALTTPGYCWYNNDAATYKNPYGALYNWYTVNTSKLAPAGWHVPTDSEWTVLTTFLGGTSVAGEALKSTGTTYWQSPNTGATNSSGFSALPSGYRNYDGSFTSVGGDGFWWPSTAYDASQSWDRFMSFNSANVGRDYGIGNVYGFSIRCLRDQN